MSSWMDYFSNPRSHYLKKTMFEVLQERYSQNEQVIERLGVSLLTEADMKAFFKLVSDIYEMAYVKAVNDHQDQLKKLGLNTRIVPDTQRSKDGM